MRRCYLCDETKPATLEHFPKDKNRTLGIGYQCRPCALRVSRERGDKRKNRWSTTMTDEQKERKRQWSARYHQSRGKAHHRVAAYRHIDKSKGHECDFDAAWFKENILHKPCIYCGESGQSGCDRIDNAAGHIKENVVPCCRVCNTTRMDTFTHSEMLLIGRVIRQIKQERRTRNASGLSGQHIGPPNVPLADQTHQPQS